LSAGPRIRRLQPSQQQFAILRTPEGVHPPMFSILLLLSPRQVFEMND
jgi:hypothetical protein